MDREKTRSQVVVALGKTAARTLSHLSLRRPRSGHSTVALVGVGMIIAGLSMGGLQFGGRTPASAPAHTIDIPVPQRPGLAAVGTVDVEPAMPGAALNPERGSHSVADASRDEAAAEALADGAWERVTVRRGQTLDGIFREQGFSIPLLHEILSLDGDTGKLAKIRPGDEFGFKRGPEGELSRMRYASDEDAFLLVDVGPDGPSATLLPRQLHRENREAEGRIESSLFLAGKSAGLSDNMIMQLANIFGWDIDFALDIRAGDRFYVVYEKVYREGEFLRDGNIIAATFINQGERFQAIRFEIDGKARYFAPDGRPMRKAFLRAPLNFSYVSSNFNPRRFHPILKRVKPHNGIDYRAPKGTPVYAAGDGRVTRSAYHKYNGHHVFIQHAGSIETRYLHFTKRTVKEGQRVAQGQVIGYVGATGLATAPHLHYEFLVHGTHRNPRTVPLPKVDPLAGSELAAFQAHAAPWQTRLGRMESASLYAQAE
jgi:murein DD-endopeptidase MepM/ murein hydrolase activator NlpD